MEVAQAVRPSLPAPIEVQCPACQSLLDCHENFAMGSYAGNLMNAPAAFSQSSNRESQVIDLFAVHG
jgi:hypothetical protein